ncbi:uncharacterized protein BX664DRAFT_387104 [Halteromyces radiatus]|uniref:uncharacterized protein n=1 Tax=Halteromyces radiatus TaxID=101107 RepID=UPI002220A00B|nr:uncharacterized protein BX664DRAFT_387104 [Halteromyces radiatus]KAI8086737.1 hypothetical protein BX664DRAFT_387104 [Halteromyces radiatus]
MAILTCMKLVHRQQRVNQQQTAERPSKRQKQSGVWTYYMAADNGEGAQCLLCLESNSQFTVKCLNGSTSGQWKHLKAKHTIKQPDRTQRNIDELFQRQVIFDNDRFNVLLAEWVAGDDQAFTSVESPFFKKLISYLNASASIWHSAYSELKEYLKICNTCQLFSPPGRPRYHHHVVDKQFRLNHILLDFIHVETRHSGEELANHLDKCLTGKLEKLWTMEGLDFDHKQNHDRCLAHIMNIAIQSALAALCCQPTNDGTDDESVPACLKKLGRCLKSTRMPPQKMDHLLRLRDGCANTLTYSPNLLTDDEWSYLGRIKVLLEEFEEATKFISIQQYPTINIVIPAYNFLMDSLERFISEESG